MTVERAVNPEEKCGLEHCPLKALPGTDRCIAHGGTAQVNSKEKKAVSMYRLGRWQERVDEFANSPKLKTLNEEIGILRMTLNERMMACHTPQDLLLNSNAIMDVITRIEKCAQTYHKMEESLGILMTKPQALAFADKLLELSKEFLPPDKLALFAERVQEALNNF